MIETRMIKTSWKPVGSNINDSHFGKHGGLF
jgi:hypothetical protein